MTTGNHDSRGTVTSVDEGRTTAYDVRLRSLRITIETTGRIPSITWTRTTTGHDSDVDDHSTARYLGDPETDESTVDRPPRAVTHWLWGILPAALTLVGLFVGSTYGYDYFVPGQSPLGALPTYAILIPYFVIGLAGTIWLYHDAIYVVYGDGDWRPSPYRYIVGGALAIDAFFLLTFPAAELATTRTLVYLVGRFITSLPIASVVAGPIYILNRNRYLTFSEP